MPQQQVIIRFGDSVPGDEAQVIDRARRTLQTIDRFQFCVGLPCPQNWPLSWLLLRFTERRPGDQTQVIDSVGISSQTARGRKWKRESIFRSEQVAQLRLHAVHDLKKSRVEVADQGQVHGI